MNEVVYWSPSVYVAPAAFVVIALVTLVWAHRTRAKGKRLRAWLATGQPTYMADEMFMCRTPRGYTVGWIGALAGLVVLAGTMIASHYPLEAEYHQWRSVTGEVERVESRFTGTGGSTSQEYVAVIGGVEHHLTDSRAALLESGDEVSLMCKRMWQYGAASILTCRWGGEVVNR